MKRRTLLLVVFLAAIGVVSAGYFAIQLSLPERPRGDLSGTVFFVGKACKEPLTVPPCDGPYPNYEVVVYAGDGRTRVGSTMTDQAGKYRLSLATGEYILYAKGFELGKVVDVPLRVVVEASQTVQQDLYVDTGVR